MSLLMLCRNNKGKSLSPLLVEGSSPDISVPRRTCQYRDLTEVPTSA